MSTPTLDIRGACRAAQLVAMVGCAMIHGSLLRGWPLALSPGLSALGHRARVLAFIRYLRFAGRRHGTSCSARDVAVLKDLALSGCDYLEAAVEVVCMDANIDECW